MFEKFDRNIDLRKSALEKEIVVDLYYNKKQSLRRIGTMFGVSAERVRQKMDEWNMPRRATTGPREDVKRKRNIEICNKYEQGESIEKICKNYDLNRSYVTTLLKKHSKLYNDRKKIRDSNICSDYRSMKVKDIAKKYNLSLVTINDIIRKSGLPRKLAKRDLKDSHLCVYLYPDELKKLHAYKEKYGVSFSYIIRQLIDKNLEEEIEY